jgi:hypothetical protein
MEQTRAFKRARVSSAQDVLTSSHVDDDRVSGCTLTKEGMELGDGDGGYLVVFDTRYGELQYLAVQAENYTRPGL